MKKIWNEYLGPQQRKVLIWCSRGKTAKEIADLLYISVRTVESHCRDICKRFQAVNIKHAIYIAMRMSLI